MGEREFQEDRRRGTTCGLASRSHDPAAASLAHGQSRERAGIALGVAAAAILLGASAFGHDTGRGEVSPPSIALIPMAAAESFVTDLRNAGDDRLFIVEQRGVVKLYKGGQLLQAPFLDLRDVVLTGTTRGLLSLAFDPEYAQNGVFYVNYTTNDPNHLGATVVARYRVSPKNPDVADPSTARSLLTLDLLGEDHNGGQLQFGPDGFLYVGTGDGGATIEGADPTCGSQRTDSLLGKVLRLDVQSPDETPPYYRVPPGNPFVGSGGDAKGEIWALGLRNPFRFSFDRQTGDLYIADPGRAAWEELDLQAGSSQGGENYGWKIMEGAHCSGLQTNTCPPSGPTCANPGSLVMPIHEYAHDGTNCAIIGGHVYRGDLIPDLRGLYVFGDWCDGKIRALDPGSRKVVELLETEFGLTSFGEDKDGELYVAVDQQVYRIIAAGPVPSSFASPMATAALTALLLLAAGAWALTRADRARRARAPAEGPTTRAF